MAILKNLKQHLNALADRRDGSLMQAVLEKYEEFFGEVIEATTNGTFNSGGLAIGTGSKKKIKIASDVYGSINGVLVKVAAAEVDFTATTHDIADTYSNIYFLTAVAAGTVTVRMGTAALTASGVAAIVPPTIPENSVVIGAVLIANGTGGLFDATTTDLDAVNLTVAYINITGPWRPGLSITAN
jgi:hypothetical protein